MGIIQSSKKRFLNYQKGIHFPTPLPAKKKKKIEYYTFLLELSVFAIESELYPYQLCMAVVMMLCSYWGDVAGGVSACL